LDNGPSKADRSCPIILAMTSAALPTSQLRPDRTTGEPPVPVARRLALVPATGRGDELVRRYRLARLRLDPRGNPSPPAPARFAHLKHPHD
jgi:hypothetical protein